MTENPLSFDKLLKSNRMRIFSNVEEYLNSRKAPFGVQGKKLIPNDYCRELLITTHESLRIGEVTYLLHNLNMQQKQLSSFKQPGSALNEGAQKDITLIVTDPLVGNDKLTGELLTKPFKEYFQINVIESPITAAIGCANINLMNNFLNKVKPKRLICSADDAAYLSQQKNVEGILKEGSSIVINP
jgi:hypothetical protein